MPMLILVTIKQLSLDDIPNIGRKLKFAHQNAAVMELLSGGRIQLLI